MLNCLKKIAFTLGIAGCFSILLPSAVFAQYIVNTGNIKIKTNELVQVDAITFAKGSGGEAYTNVLQKKSGDVVCGKIDNICKADQYCLRCKTEKAEVTKVGGLKVKDVAKNEWTCAPRADIDNAENRLEYARETYMPKCDPMKSLKDGVSVGGTVGGAAGGAAVGAAIGSIIPGVGTVIGGLIGAGIGAIVGSAGEIKEVVSFLIEEFGFLDDSKREHIGITFSETTHGWTGTNSKNYSLRLTDGNPTIAYAAENFEGCEVMPVKLYGMQRCWFCPLSALIFKAANNITIMSFAFFSSPFKALLVMVWAVWLAYMTLQQVFPMTKQDAPKFLSTIMKQSFKFLVAYLLIVYSEDIFRLFIVPILDAGLQLGTAIQTVKLRPIDAREAGLGNWSGGLEEVYFNRRLHGGPTLYEKIEIYLATLQLTLAYMQVIGSTLFCVGGKIMIALDFEKIKAGLRIMIFGSILTIFAFLLTLAFAFYFLDGLLQLVFIGAMMPLMIAGWPFRATAQYATTGFKMLLNTFFIIFFTGFVISVDIELVNQSISLSQAQQQDVSLSSTDSDVGSITSNEKKDNTADGFASIVEAINTQNEANLKTATDIGGVGFMLLIFCCVFGFKFVKEVTPLAGTLAGGGGLGVASKIGTMAASAAKGVASKATSPVRKAAGDAIKSKVGKGMGKLKNGAGNFLQNATKGKSGLIARGVNAMGRGLKESAAKSSGGQK